MKSDTDLPDICSGCGQKARGLASITFVGDDGELTRRYCHEGDSPTCYEAAQAAVAIHGGWIRSRHGGGKGDVI